MLIGQDRAEAILSRALQQDRVSHAYLFTGPEGVGKTTAAMLFTQALNCERRTGEFTTETQRHGDDTDDRESGRTDQIGEMVPLSTLPLSSVSPCLRVDSLSECASCRRIAAGTHPDVHVIVPGSKSGQNISVEQIRDIRQDVARRPIMDRRKVYLIPAAETMNEEAANALLKTLEEPPHYVTLVLMAVSPTRILPTVLSRCQVVPFGLVSAEIIQKWLEAKGATAEAAAELAFSAGGRPGLALRWSREPEALERRRQLFALLEEIVPLRQRARQNAGESIAALRLAERARALVGPEEGEGQGNSVGPARAVDDSGPVARVGAKPMFMRLLELVRGYYRDLLLLSQDAPEALLWNGDRVTALKAAAEQHDPGELVVALLAIDRCRQFLERNVAPQLALETLFLDLLQPEAITTATAGAAAR